MTSRPTVNVFGADGTNTGTTVTLPDVFVSPIRPDLVQAVHTGMAKNRRQPYGVKVHNGACGIVAGHQHSAHSWGTGRAVSRIPRVSGGGTHRAGQGAFGNMCRGGRMFAPTKTWRKWHKKVNLKQKRAATASALAASAVPALVMARGHRIDECEEIPLVVTDDLQNVKQTQALTKLLVNGLHLGEELNRCTKKHKRAGRGKMRNRRFRNRVGPLLVYDQDNKLVAAARNILGVDTCQVSRLNLLQLAPGGHLGRLIVWTKSAFEQLNTLYGTANGGSVKKGFTLPRASMNNSDLTRIINSQEVQSVLNPAGPRRTKGIRRKKNPLKNLDEMRRLNPYKEECVREDLKRHAKKRKRAQPSKEEKAKRQKIKEKFVATLEM